MSTHASHIEAGFQLGDSALTNFANMLEAAQRSYDDGREQLDAVMAGLPKIDNDEAMPGKKNTPSLVMAWQNTQSGLSSLHSAADRAETGTKDAISAFKSLELNISATAPKSPDGRYAIGDPKTPVLVHDDTFIYNSKHADSQDYLNKEKWQAMLLGARYLRPDLDDATMMYKHYWDNNGKKMEFDYDEAYHEDGSIREAVDREIGRAATAADYFVQTGKRSFKITGGPKTAVSSTENWEKTVGNYQQWSHANVRVEGKRIVMDVTVEAQDYYDFDKGKSDIATGVEDSENGRFTEIGWAKPFETHGSLTRTVSWEVGQPPSTMTTDASSKPHQNRTGDER
ncbi:hypothetical protein [Nocardia sp. NPDC046763]|uniref:hypothetical protein n=1 Tax=Nocardia sp. NPDC046763 TaxID=3155256 RepID=UPI0033CA7A2B